jgi:hypothetical protein
MARQANERSPFARRRRHRMPGSGRRPGALGCCDVRLNQAGSANHARDRPSPHLAGQRQGYARRGRRKNIVWLRRLRQPQHCNPGNGADCRRLQRSENIVLEPKHADPFCPDK